MAEAVIARQQGDDFQARIFWLHAAQLLDENSSVVRVSFETGPKAFDDVVVEHAGERAPQDYQGRRLLRVHMQLKWHVRPGDFGYEDFIDPAFTGGTSVSILKRVHDAQLQYAPQGEGARFQLVTNWNALAPLRDLIMNQTNAIDLAALFKGGGRSAMGKLRASWAEHLVIDEDELRRVIRTLGVNLRIRSGEDIRAHLNDRLRLVGLREAPASEAGFFYDDLIRKLHAQGRKVFDRKTFREMAEEERILTARAQQRSTVIGVRSFMHPIDNIEARTAASLNLVPYFDGRYLRDKASWNSTIYPELRDFVIGQVQGVDDIQIVLDAHVSLAFAVGTILDVKSGKRVEVEQRTQGRRFWSPDDVAIDPNWPGLDLEEIRVGAGHDVAVAVGLTHDITENVQEFVAMNLPSVGSVVLARPETGPSQLAIRSGSHAMRLAEVLSDHLRRFGRDASVHLFIAGPNGFTFFLGQNHKSFGPATVYEWDFEGLRSGGYSPGLTTP